jgi:hypothetical protein
MSIPAILNQTATALDPTAAVPESQVTGLVADLAARSLRFLRSGLYHRTVPAASLTTSATLGVGTLRLAPFDVPRAVTLTRIGAEITSAGDVGSKFRLGIYADDGTGYPGALTLDAGTIDGNSATVQEITINQLLAAGRYWVGGVVQGVTVTQPTLRTVSIATIDAGSASLFTAAQTVYGFAQGSVTVALPSPSFTVSVSGSGAMPAVFVKVS